jgi:hypothetical protein
MSNPQAQGSQGPPQQQAGQLLKADDLSKLRCLTDDQKQKYRPVLQNFWGMMQTKPAGSPEHSQARAKLQEWSLKLINQERQFRLKQQQLQQQGQNQQNQQAQSSQQPPQPTPEQSQPPAQQQQPQAQPQAQAQAQAQQPAAQAPNQPAQQGNRPQGGPLNAAQPSPEVVKHVNGFPYYLPPDGPMPGTPQAEQAYQQMRAQYLTQLTRQERSSNRMKALSNMLQQRKQQGQEIPPELMNQKSQIEKEYHGAKTFVEDFRKRQKEWQSQGGRPVHGHQQQPQQPAQQGGQTQQQSPTQAQQQSQQPTQNAVKQEPQIKVEGGQAPQAMQQQFNNMQSGGPPQQPQQPQQNAQISAPSAAQQQPRPPPGPHSQQGPQPNQAQFAQPGQQHPPRPQINPQQANTQMQQQSNSPHPQSATSAAGQPIPLSHHAAVSAANRSYSQPDGQRTTTPLQGGQGSFHAPGSREREQLNNPKMPIPRTLNVTPVTPVGMGQARPTMSGPTNGAPGPMGQPVINKFPPFQLEGEGDRVLSKRKLDELVRQVTGGSEDALTPEVEEVSSFLISLNDLLINDITGYASARRRIRRHSYHICLQAL